MKSRKIEKSKSRNRIEPQRSWRYTVISAPFGSVGLVVSSSGLSNVILTGRKGAEAKAYLQGLFPDARYERNMLSALQRQLREYFAGRAVRFRTKIDLSSAKAPPLAAHSKRRAEPALQGKSQKSKIESRNNRGDAARLSSPKSGATHLSGYILTAFQRKVLLACAKIGHGRTMSYGELARRIGKPKAARAVGAALGQNPIPIVIPCHRVIAADGSLCGFSAEQGIGLKKRLLEMEADSGESRKSKIERRNKIEPRRH